jgi:CDP-glycerol glycerophosphotransferase (TagB/SpsB family)
VQFLANLTRHADLNINFASTMTLDFSIHDKPVINVVFEVTDPPLYGESMWDFVRGFEHYDPVVNLGAARFAHTVDEFAAHINAYLKNPSLDREGRRKFVELEVGAPVGESSRLIVETLQKIAGRN